MLKTNLGTFRKRHEKKLKELWPNDIDKSSQVQSIHIEYNIREIAESKREKNIQLKRGKEITIKEKKYYEN